MTIQNGNLTAQSNFDRLRAHLKNDSLALALLEAWAGRIDEADRARAMLDALNTFKNSKQDDDEQTISEEN